MKKILLSLPMLAMAFCYAETANASGGHGKGHHKFKHGHGEEVVHYYVPVGPPTSEHYYPVPVSAPQPYHYSVPDRRSTSGLTGSVVGGALGYQIGNGNPLAAGVGAAAGSLIGNEIAK